MSASRKYSLAFCMALFCHVSYSQFESSNQMSFNRLNTQDGLSQASVNCILQDSKGFLWFGTDDGLNRFDGSRFRIFRHLQGDSSSIMGNNIQAIFEDEKNNIWIGTSEGLALFDRTTEKFTRYYLGGYEYYTVSDLAFDSHRNRLWIASNTEGILYLDLATGILHIYENQGLRGVTAIKVKKVTDTLLVGTQEHGLMAIDLSSNALTKVQFNDQTKDAVLAFPVRALFARNNQVWVGTQGGGIVQFDVKTNESKLFSVKNNLLSDDKVWAIATTDNEKIWIGTDGGGLTVYHVKSNSSSFYKHSEYNPRTLSSNTIRSLIVDKNNDIWLGTFNGGVSYHSNFNINFLSFHKDPLDAHSLRHEAVLSFMEDSHGVVYVGTDGGGLTYMKNGEFFPFEFPNNVETPSVILSIDSTDDGGLLLGTYQNGFYFITPGHQIVQYKNNPNDSTTISSDIVWDIDEDVNGDIWLATEMGLNRFNRKKGDFTHLDNITKEDNPQLFTGDFIQSLLIDSKQRLWGGMYGMLLMYDMKSGIVKNFLSTNGTDVGVPNKQILSICEDPSRSDAVWFSARGEAVVMYDIASNQFSIISEKQGLPNSLVYALRADLNGIVWMTTNKGLVRYNPGKHEFFTFANEFGINVEPFNDNAAYSTKNGYLLFGGANGFIAFIPSKPDFKERQFEVSFTGFQLFNEEVKIDNQILERSITEEDEIELSHEKARFISFNFSALQFLAPSSIRYQYKLEGFDTTWYEAENRTVSFINLLPGDYKLHIKAGYGAGFWGKERVLSIRIVPPWWMMWYARGAGVVLFLFLGYAILRFRTYNLKKRKLQLERIVAEQNRAIRSKNVELESQNQELLRHNEELTTQRETIRVQNEMLSEAKAELQQVNQSLESQVQQRTERLNDTISVLNKTIKELDAFLYSASHDLVAPLKSVIGLVNLARAEDADRKLTPYLDHIENTVRKLEGVIHTLMQHSYNAKAADQRHVADLRGLVTEAIAEQQFMPEAKRIKFNIDFDKAFISTDIPRMKIILSNLIGNAIKYHDPEKENNTVDISFHRNGERWSMVLQDNGIGIERSRINRIFDMFYRATESAKGSGLGLYIVKETIERLGGEIVVESEARQGTKFTLEFPLISAD
jgi:signal transduction histidine kinase/ligand-binding sensor domain-containing protein